LTGGGQQPPEDALVDGAVHVEDAP
jgi:hypothetical protein